MYIGKAPVNGFHSKQQISGDGSEVTFTLDYTVADETSLIVSDNAVVLEPKTGYNLATGGTKITFASAPASGQRTYIQFLGQAVVQNLLDLNGAEFFLDGDADTTITADSDDTIDFKIGGTDEIKMTSAALSPAASDGNALGTAALEWSDLFLADGAVINFGDDQDVSLTHVADTGLLLSSTDRLQFGDSGTYIFQSADGVLDLVSDTEIELNATTLDINANVEISGTTAQVGVATFTARDIHSGGITIANDGQIGSVGDANSIIISSAGVVTMDQIPVFSAGINVSGGTIAGTLSTAAQGSVTSLGTLTALTVDDVAVDGKVITMTGSAGDTFTTTVGTNGATTLTTVDTAAAAANITITADGTAELAGTTVTLNSGGGVTLDADNGTITFADGGSSLGTITSSGYSGTAALATTVTVTDNESTNENNVLTFVAGAAAAGGNVGLESDGNLTYNPSTGTLSATNVSVTGTMTTVDSVTMSASNAVVFEGSTADGYETTLTTVDPTADRTITLPNIGGTVPVLAAASNTQITATPAEINLIDGGTARGTDAIADGDGVLINDGGTMKMTTVETLSAYLDDEITSMPNLTTAAALVTTAATTVGALASGSIATGFGAIDNGTSNITSGGLVSIDTDADADDNTADSSSGRLTIGASGDLNLYHGGTNSYIVNSTGNLIFHSETDDSDIVFTGEDGSSGITAMTLDMSEGGALMLNGGLIDLKNNGSAVSKIKLYCEDNNAHAQTLQGAPHSAAATNTLTLPTTGGSVALVSTASTDTLTNKTLTAPTITTGVFNTGAIFNEDSADVDFRVESNGNTHMIFVDGGSDHVNIGTSSDLGGVLNVNGTIYGPGAVGLNSGDYIGWTDNTHTAFVVNGNEEMRLEADGDLHVDGDVVAFSTTISDATLKYNISPVEFALDKIQQLKGVTFNYFKDGKESAGLLAQDVEKVMPSAVSERKLPLHTGDNKSYKTLHYDSMTAILVEAIKELTAKVKKLEER